MKRIIYTGSDGGLRITLPAEGSRLCSKVTLSDGSELKCEKPQPVEEVYRRWRTATVEWAETQEQFLSRVQSKAVPADAVNVRAVDVAEIPADRTFRHAWQDTGTVSVNMTKARAIHRDRLRALRFSKFLELDVAYMKALEAGDSVRLTEIARKKQALRDVTAAPEIEAAKTPEDLRDVIPACLQAGFAV